MRSAASNWNMGLGRTMETCGSRMRKHFLNVMSAFRPVSLSLFLSLSLALYLSLSLSFSFRLSALACGPVKRVGRIPEFY